MEHILHPQQRAQRADMYAFSDAWLVLVHDLKVPWQMSAVHACSYSIRTDPDQHAAAAIRCIIVWEWGRRQARTVHRVPVPGELYTYVIT